MQVFKILAITYDSSLYIDKKNLYTVIRKMTTMNFITMLIILTVHKNTTILTLE